MIGTIIDRGIRLAIVAVACGMLVGCAHGIATGAGSDPGGLVDVRARAKYTALGTVVAGRRYRFESHGRWRDAVILRDAKGFDSKGIMRIAEHRRRHPQARWFALVGIVTATPGRPQRDADSLVGVIDFSRHLVSDGESWIAPASGTVHVFANDAPRWYWNNSGRLRVRLVEAPQDDAR